MILHTILIRTVIKRHKDIKFYFCTDDTQFNVHLAHNKAAVHQETESNSVGFKGLDVQQQTEPQFR